MVKTVSVKEAQKKISESFSQFTKQKILIIGDIGLDEYVTGPVSRISPEAPVPVLEVKEEFFRLGLSTNVAQNIKAMGATPLLVSVVGDDIAGERLKSILSEYEISSEHIVHDKTRPTTRKIRMMSDIHHIVRVDYETKQSISKDAQEQIFSKISTLMPNCSAVILQDYAKGLLSESLNQKIIALAKASNKEVFVDPHDSKPLKEYLGATLMTPNLKEAHALSKWQKPLDLISDEDVVALGKEIQSEIQSPAMVITRSKDGMNLFEGEQVAQVPTFARQVYDVTGAGDTVIAAISLAKSSGLNLEESCVFANLAAGIVVAKVGAATATLEEIQESMNSY